MAKLGIDLKNSKNVKLALMVLGLALVVVYVRFLLLPQISGVRGLTGNINKVHGDVVVSERDVANINNLKKEIAKYQDKIESYEQMLPAEQEIPKLLENLSQMARDSNVKIIGITPLPPKGQAQSSEQIYQEKPILITAKSGYHELGKFLSKLENSNRFMKVVDIKIKTNSATPKRHDVELLVLTYVLLINK